ncbi:hypothetical protein CEXT_421381 [Caerostris extrusa]|uniref:Uncharacterized protein n=1 Tax=Caerostris extrusa TaxID=172846 RepID=A0AAV4W4D4_CAEEX|nr:hypothetical protein CEXT_421381 [Caerostris extrusa]
MGLRGAMLQQAGIAVHQAICTSEKVDSSQGKRGGQVADWEVNETFHLLSPIFSCSWLCAVEVFLGFLKETVGSFENKSFRVV